MSFNPAGGALYVVLRPHADAAAFTRQATALAARYRVGNIQVVHLATDVRGARSGPSGRKRPRWRSSPRSPA